VISYSVFDFETAFSKDGINQLEHDGSNDDREDPKDRRRIRDRHMPTFVKQFFYFILFVILNLILTIWTEVCITDDMKLIDVHGNHHELTPHHVRVMIGLGWATFIGSWVANICYYKVHPSSVDFSPKRFREKWFIYVLGNKKYLYKVEREDGEGCNNGKETLCKQEEGENTEEEKVCLLAVEETFELELEHDQTCSDTHTEV